MEINIHHLLEGARQARGLTIVIDVFRAFSTACYACAQGAGPVLPVDTVEEAFRLKTLFPEALLIGERNEQKPAGFDFGNSPTHLLNVNIRGKRIIHTTSSGTRGIVNATSADIILTGSFVNASAIVRYIRKVDPAVLSLVCMGYACEYPTDEDTLCAEYLRNELTGQLNDWESMKKKIKEGSGARFFEEKSQSWAPASDFDLCLQPSKFNFILKVANEENLVLLEKIVI